MDRDETGEEVDYSRKGGNAHSEFAVPPDAPAWIAEYAADFEAPETSAFFWNAVEAHEARRDAQLMREFVLALPNELTVDQNIDLVREFVSQELSAQGIVADWAYHDLPDNPHVHLMTSLRQLTEDGFGAKRVPILSEDGAPVRGADGKIRSVQFTGGRERLKAMRAAWADIQNHHLAKHGHDIRVDHRSFEELGIYVVPSTHRGPAADNMDARGELSELATKARIAARENYERYAQDPDLVLKKLTIQKAVFTRHDIAREIHRTECTPAEFQALFYRVGASEELVPIAAPSFDPFTGDETSEPLFSTKAMVALEYEMVRNIQGLASKPGVQIAERRLEKVYAAFETKRGFALNAQQKMVVRHLTGESSAAALVGYAGAGKSTTMDATRMALENDGYTVIGGALAGIAADNLRSEAGVQSRTLASWEYQWAKGNLLPDNKTIFVMDEAGMVSSPQMERITRQLNEAGARMIALGDARQLQPIQAGAAFRAFVDVSGYVELDSVVRQSTPWMRDAAVAFGSGDAEAGVSAYLDQNKVTWSESNDAARAALIQDWMPYHQASADCTIMAHRNKDVIGLNVEARTALKQNDALGEDHAFAAERGPRAFADGDRVLFLKNERSLGVFNGSTGTVTKADKNRLEVIVDSHADPVTIRANEYNTLDHGYARTIHKEQGNTVDQSFVYLSPTMDAQLSYVALTRHRDDVNIYASQEDFSGPRELFEAMTRDRLQDSTVLYRDTVDYKDVVRGFAERRGYPSTEAIVDFVKSNVAYLRERFDRLAAKFDQLRKPVPEKDLLAGSMMDRVVQTKIVVQGQELPSMSPRLGQSMERLSHALVADTMRGRKARGFERSAHYELNMAGSADELRRFNVSVATQIGSDAILTHGSHQPQTDASLLRDQPAAWQRFARENWDAIFAAQWAGTQASLQPLTSQPVTKDPVIQPKGKVPMSDEYTKAEPQQPPLIEAVPDMPALPPIEVRARVVQDDGLDYSTAVTRDVAGRMYHDKDAAMQALLSRYEKTGDAPKLLSELERNPAILGEMKGKTRLGLANGERRNALEITPQLTEKAGEVFRQVGLAEARIVAVHAATQAARAKPLPDLSENAQQFLSRVATVEQMSPGEAKNTQRADLMKDRQSQREVTAWRQVLSARYGKGADKIREGVKAEPTIKAKPAPERQAVLARVDTVLTGFPMMVNMQTQAKQQGRNRGLEQDQSRGIER
jgi:Ti-type conjugative transfer relaxase TraA